MNDHNPKAFVRVVIITCSDCTGVMFICIRLRLLFTLTDISTDSSCSSRCDSAGTGTILITGPFHLHMLYQGPVAAWMDHSYQLHHCCNSPAVAKWAAVSKMYERGPKKMFLLSVMIPVREWPRTSAAPLWRIKAFVIVFMFRGWCCVTPTCVVPDHLQLNSTLFHTHTLCWH